MTRCTWLAGGRWARVQRLYEGQDNTGWDGRVEVDWGEGPGVGSFLKRLMQRRREGYNQQGVDATLAVRECGFAGSTNCSSQESCSHSVFHRRNRT